VSVLAYDLVGKRLEIVRQLAVAAGPIGFLINPKGAGPEVQLKDIGDAARRLGQPIEILNAGTPDDIDAAFASLARLRVGALVVSTDAFLFSQRRHIIGLAERYAVPAIYDRREFATAGGLICYGTRYADAFRQVGIYTGKILRGARPADLPVQQVATFELIINMKTAKALNLTVPPNIVALSDEVIE
jgi:putative ABC transport system substrate-binding protein